MNRHFGLAMLVSAGVVLGCALGSYQGTHAAVPAMPAAPKMEEQTAILVDQVKELKNQVKEINSLLHNGNVKVVVLINPDAGKR